jgi:hypothetical protein
MGVNWTLDETSSSKQLEGPVGMDEAVEAMQQAASDWEPAVRELTGSDAPFNLTVEVTDIDAYWSYWLDGAGSDVRMRLNHRNAKDRFTRARAVHFSLHEILGHGLQSASISKFCRKNEVSFVRLLSVHARQQMLLEGLAQALPLFVMPDDKLMNCLVRREHYAQLVRGEVHLAINRGDTIAGCVEHARRSGAILGR